MARSPETVVARRASGVAIEASVSVFDRVTGDPVDIWAAETGGAPLPQPVATNPLTGALTFWHETDKLRIEVVSDVEVELAVDRPGAGAGGGGGGGSEILRGLHEDRPAANAGVPLYCSEDRGITYHSDGAGWLPLGPGVLVLGADHGPVADNTLVSSPDLRFPMFEGDHLAWQLWGAVESTSINPDIRVNVKPPSEATATPSSIRWQQALGQYGRDQTIDPGALIAGSPINGLGPGIKPIGYAGWVRGDQLTDPGVPDLGEAVVQWAQNTTTPANPITMKKGSYLLLHDLTRP